MNPLEIAARYVGDHETSRNHSEDIKTFWPDTSYPEGYNDRQPYCAAFICHCIAQAAREGWQHKVKALPREASVRYFLEWCQGRMGVHVFKPSQEEPQAGDVAIFLPNLSHMGIVELYDRSKGVIHTIEGNTDPSGGRDGDGIYRRTRKVNYPGWYVRFL